MHYAELHCKTNFSFLEGASRADELVRQAAELGYRALAVTDRNSLAGVVRAHIAAKEARLPLVIGAEITPTDAPPVVLWTTDRASYGRLCRLITRGRRQAPKGECALKLQDVAEFAEGLVAGVRAGDWGLRAGDVSSQRLETIVRGPRSVVRDKNKNATDDGRWTTDNSSLQSPAPRSSRIVRYLMTAATCWRSLLAGRMTVRGWLGCKNCRARWACRWWRRGMCIITCRGGWCCTMC